MSEGDTITRRRSELSAAKRALFERRMRGEPIGTAGSQLISRCPNRTSTILSFAQQRLWFLNQLDEGGSAYNLPEAWHLTGHLDVNSLEKSIRKLLARHQVLRMSFVGEQGVPVEAISTEESFKLSAIDLIGYPPGEREAKARQLMTEEACRPFDLSQGPLVRAILLRTGELEYDFLLVLHHIVTDGWSFGVLRHEIAAFYNAISAGQAPALPVLPIQYQDYAYWQRQWIKGDVLQTQLAYWKQRLAGTLPLLQLPTDYQRPATQSSRGANEHLSMRKSLLEALNSLSRQECVSLFMMLFAAYCVLLYRHTGQEDILVGVPIANRTRTEVESLIGFFVNTLVLRADMSGNPTFRDLLSRIREVALEAYAHQDLPFEKLVEELQPQRDLSFNPLFQAMFVLRNAPAEPLELAGVAVKPIEVETHSSMFDLTLYMTEEAEGLTGWFEYSTDLFSYVTIKRLVARLQTLLEGIVADPGKRISDLPLLPEAEATKVLVQWNDTCAGYPQDVLLHQLFEAQVERTPNAIAVDFEGKQLTYRELNERANRLAHFLRKLGVGPDTLVAVCMERSLELVMALYGILKAGGAYVPIDPEYPQERVAFMMQDASAAVLLTQTRLADSLREGGATVLCLDGDWDRIAAEDPGNQSVTMKPDNLAYMIYTSGSTGKPKGAMNTHRGICNRLLWMQEYFALTTTDRVLQKTPFSFDVSVWELFWPLLVGARMVVAAPGGHRDSAYLVKLIGEQHITVCHFVPSMLRVFLEEAEVGRCGSLRHVICSGEALPFELQERFFALLSCELHNLYGPTEAAVDVTYWTCRRGSERKVVPIGKPVANTQIYILDRLLQPVPIGVPGELYIGGVQVGRGYHNRPELTAERFISDPYSRSPGARLYKTGDLCRWLEDGSVEYLGRMDFQVKIRGNRIELGEIEAALSQHPEVSDAVVMVRERQTGDKTLVAYVAGHGENPSLEERLRQYLKERLPDYMIPSLFVIVEKMPLTSNGKVDRLTLSKYGNDQPKSETHFVAPRDELEFQVAGIWASVLGLESISVQDDFFALGGHSLLAAQLFAKIERVMGRRIPLASIFRASTVEQFAILLREKEWKPSWSSLVAIQPGGSKPPLFLCHGAEGNVLLYRELALRLGSDRPVYGLQSQGLDGNGHVATSIEDMAAHYMHEIQSLQPKGPYYLGGYCMGGAIALEIAQQLHAKDQEVALVALLETYNISSNPKVLSFPYKCCHRIQTVIFHLDNFLLLRGNQALAFFRHKARVQRARAKAALAIWLSARIRKFRSSSRSAYPHIALTRVNDAAFERYRPRPFAGRVVLFRPKRYYFGLHSREFGWNEVVKDGVNVHCLTVNPHGMLVEPFVDLLAENLKTYLEDGQKAN